MRVCSIRDNSYIYVAIKVRFIFKSRCYYTGTGGINICHVIVREESALFTFINIPLRR